MTLFHDICKCPTSLSLRKSRGKSRPQLTSGTDNTILPRLSCSQKAKRNDYALAFFGAAQAEGKELLKPATPADQKTQAFITHHIVEAQQTHLSVRGPKQAIAHVQKMSAEPIALQAGKSQQVVFKTLRFGKQKLHFALKNAPEGITMSSELEGSKLTLTFNASEAFKASASGNLIVEVYSEGKGKKNNKNKSSKKKKPNQYSLGYLPAIPFEANK